MNRHYFRIISLVVVASLTLLAGVQCWWVTKMYHEQESDFERRVESAAYKSVYKSFRMDAIPGLVAAQRINIDLDDFALVFDPALLELDAMTEWQAEIIDRTMKDRVVMHRLIEEEITHPHTALIEIDDDGVFALRLTYARPVERFWSEMWVLLLSSVVIVVLLAAVLGYLVWTMKRQRTLEEMRRDFTHNITHELKTPISVAVAATDALRNFSADSDPERRSRYLEMVELQLTQLSAMVERILSVSVEGHKERCNPTRMLLRPLLESLTAGLKLGFKKPLTIELNCSEEVWVVADRFHLKNTLATLIDNALKYSREELTLRLEASTEGNTTTILVSDNGIGIAKEHLPYLFDKFYRVPTGDLQPSRGYGLGLYYARRVIELHGGTIEVKSRRMQGTTFTLKLPYDVC